jgi:hypothetical protein
MNSILRRQAAWLLAILTAIAGLPGSTATAATATVHGRLIYEYGLIPPGSVVRVVPEGGGVTIEVAVAADNSFLLSQIPEGTYRVEVVDPKGAILGTARAVIPAKASALDITVYGHPSGASTYIGQPPPTTPSPRLVPPGGKGYSVAVVVWSAVGALVLGYFIGDALADDDEKCVSPSTPGCP